MPPGLNSLDAMCVAAMVSHSPITFTFGGVDYVGTAGARDTMLSLTDGGFNNDQEFSLLVETAQFGSDSRPGEKQKIAVCVDADGIPCGADDSVRRLAARIQTIGRAGGGLTYTLRADTRG